jgi:hypothetical protein
MMANTAGAAEAILASAAPAGFIDLTGTAADPARRWARHVNLRLGKEGRL